jgi:predicted outer membrane repeat protein
MCRSGNLGGAVYLYRSNAFFRNNTFRSNIAQQLGGSVAIIEEDVISEPSVFKGTNTFESNRAGVYGGAIYFKRIEPVIDAEIRFRNNEIGDVSSYPHHLELGIFVNVMGGDYLDVTDFAQTLVPFESVFDRLRHTYVIKIVNNKAIAFSEDSRSIMQLQVSFLNGSFNETQLFLVGTSKSLAQGGKQKNSSLSDKSY